MKKVMESVIFVIIFLFIYFSFYSGKQTDKVPLVETKQEQLSDERAIEFGKMLNEEYNLNTNIIFNLSYYDNQVETDGYNRYIIKLNYQFETSNRFLKKNTVYAYFKYDPVADEIIYKPYFGCLWIDTDISSGADFIKTKDDFFWGKDLNEIDTQGNLDENLQIDYNDSHQNNNNSTTKTDYDSDFYEETDSTYDTIKYTLYGYFGADGENYYFYLYEPFIIYDSSHDTQVSIDRSSILS